MPRVASQHNPDKDYELKVVQALAYARAFETECALIACNAGGDRDKDGFMGGSGVWAPLLGKFAGFEGEEVGVRVVDVDLGILKVRGRRSYMILYKDYVQIPQAFQADCQASRDLYQVRSDADRRCG